MGKRKATFDTFGTMGPTGRSHHSSTRKLKEKHLPFLFSLAEGYIDASSPVSLLFPLCIA